MVTARSAFTKLLVLLLALSFAFTPQFAPAQDRRAFSQPELDQMLAPIALYPDALLSQILMAATYPLEVVEAARWSKAHRNLAGDQAVAAADQFGWDPSVKSLLAVPRVLDMMDDKLDWTRRLGDAFLAQSSQVMDTVQNLRQRAYAAGNLRSTGQVRVEQQGPHFYIEYADPLYVYAPYYDPRVIYGPWWWPAYAPVFWAPWPGYYASPGFVIAWGIGIAVSTGFFFGAIEWGQHRIRVAHTDNYYFRREAGTVIHAPGSWQHDPAHRQGVPYRDAAVRHQFDRAVAPAGIRDEFRGHATTTPATPPVRADARGGAVPRPDAIRPPPAAEPRPAPPSASVRIQAPGPNRIEPPSRPAAPVVDRRPGIEPRPHVFEGVNQGAQVRGYSERGNASVQSSPARPAPAGRPAGAAPAPHQGGGAPRAAGNPHR